MNCTIRLPLFIALSLIACSTANAQRALELLEELQSVYSTDISLTASVKIRVAPEEGALARENHGTILLDRDRFRFDSDTDVLVRDTETTTLYRRQENQVLITYATESRGLSPSEFLSDVDVLGVETELLNGIAHEGLRLAPRISAMGIREVVIWLRSSDFAISAVSAAAAGGTIFELYIDAIEFNPQIHDSAFAFEPPSDAEVIDMRF